MKITLDISKLVEEGSLVPRPRSLKALASHDTGSLGINILIGFAVVAIAAGAVALVPTPLTAVGLGLALTAAGLAIVVQSRAAMDRARADRPGDRRADVLRRRSSPTAMARSLQC